VKIRIKLVYEHRETADLFCHGIRHLKHTHRKTITQH